MRLEIIKYDDNLDRSKATISLSGPEVVTLNNALREYIEIHDKGAEGSEGVYLRAGLRADLFILSELLLHGGIDGWAMRTAAGIRDRTVVSSTTAVSSTTESLCNT